MKGDGVLLSQIRLLHRTRPQTTTGSDNTHTHTRTGTGTGSGSVHNQITQYHCRHRTRPVGPSVDVAHFKPVPSSKRGFWVNIVYCTPVCVCEDALSPCAAVALMDSSPKTDTIAPDWRQRGVGALNRPHPDGCINEL